MTPLQLIQVDFLIVDPELADGVHPLRAQDLDIRPLAGHILVLRRIGVTDDEMGDIGREVKLVKGAHLLGTSRQIGLDVHRAVSTDTS